MKNKINKVFPVIFSTLLLSTLVSCKKLVEIDPPTTSQNTANVFTNDATAIAALTGEYTFLSAASLSDPKSLYSYTTSVLGLTADELNVAGTANQNQFFTNDYQPSTIGDDGLWTFGYTRMYGINNAIEQLQSNTKLTPGVRQQLLGEAKFLRALYYFYLTGVFGNVPLALTTDYTVNAQLARSSKDVVYAQMIKDLSEAKDELSSNFMGIDLLTVTSERVRPSKWAALALLSRVYFYQGDYINAENTANQLIGNSLFSLPSLNDVFLKNSKEAIWQLQPVIINQNTVDASFFIIPSTGFDTFHSVYVSNSLLNSFEPGDQRKSNWLNSYTDVSVTPNVKYYYPYKYKVVNTGDLSEYQMVFRLGEQYLIRAESRAQQGKLTDAQADLNVVRTRAGLGNYAGGVDKNAIISAVQHERQVEFFTELGQRWLDLKRSGTIDQVMSTVAVSKGGSWSSYKALFPISENELNKSINVTQTPGY